MGKFVLQKIFFSMENIFLKIEFFSLFGSIKKNIFFIKRLFFNYGFFNDSNKIREIAMCMIKLVAVVILMIIVLMIVIFMIPLMLVVME